MSIPMADAAKHPNPTAHPFSKFRSKLDNLSSDLSRLGVAVKTTWNPNHRHDEEWEHEVDSKIEAIRDGHRFRSFAGERDGNIVKWHVDGHDYFWALSEVIDSAKESIMILDWWLSPELQLRRPAALFPEWRLDRLLKRKAEEGVRIYVMVYKEVTASMALSSKHTKHALEDLHDNIAVMRHPDHSGGELIYYFSHHEKLCVVDNRTAAMGGLDACYGRWDTRDHPLSDVHPTEFYKSLFPGQDYNNSRIMDFQTVQKYTSNALAIQDAPRMPWHDTSMTLIGPSVVDLVQHFCERWNFVKKIKYKHDHRMEWLSLPFPWDDVCAARDEEKRIRGNEFRQHHPHLAEWKELGRQLYHPYHFPPSEAPRASEPVPSGSCRIQVLRSAADWSHGILLENSIQGESTGACSAWKSAKNDAEAYIGMIREANHCIYIENQFCHISACDKGQPVENQIGAAIAARIISAATEGRKFKVIVLIPAVPAFPGDIQSQSGLKAIMEAQYRTINRGGSSIFEQVREAGFDPMEYITFWNLRSYDRINSPWAQIKQMEQKSGVTFHEAQVALAKIYVGSDDVGGDIDEVVNIEKPHDQSTKVDQIGKKDTVEKAVKLPKTVDEAKEIIRRFESALERSDKHVSDNICQHALQDKTSLLDEQWSGTDEEELSCIVSEICYIHSKIMIVDDRRVICGSANLNDRSQNGDHDSEIAILMEDQDMVESRMDGKKYMASRLATTWRRTLMREHIGLLPPQPAFDRDSQPNDAMRPAPVENQYDWGSAEDLAVEDVLSDEFERLWVDTGRANRAAFENVFRPVPNDTIKSWKDYAEYLKPNAGISTGHVADKTLSLQQVKEELAKIKGHLVDMPCDFLIQEKWMTEGNYLSVNPITLALYV